MNLGLKPDPNVRIKRSSKLLDNMKRQKEMITSLNKVFIYHIKFFKVPYEKELQWIFQGNVVTKARPMRDQGVAKLRPRCDNMLSM